MPILPLENLVPVLIDQVLDRRARYNVEYGSCRHNYRSTRIHVWPPVAVRTQWVNQWQYLQRPFINGV
jgi:hypothetical protein